jgi:hypothetical protein
VDIKEDPTQIAQRLAEFRLEHRGLDEAIAKLIADPVSEDLQIRRLKKRKLKLKDSIAMLESKLIPDLDA